MNKKLIAVAVAGALGAPALAFAQASTVSIYGSIRVQYGYVDEGGSGINKRNKFDTVQNEGGSAIGFRGEEKLGSGLSAWFQCESTLDVQGVGQTLCRRNSAVGFKHASFGNIFIGNWDMPYKLAAGGQFRPGTITSGLLGTASILHQESATVDNTSNVATFHRRQNNSVHYHTPVWQGFQAMVGISAKNEVSGTVDGIGAGALGGREPRVISVGATYRNGPIHIGGGYERHNDFRALAGAPAGTFGDDEGWNINAAYTFSNLGGYTGGWVTGLTIGGIFERLNYETGAPGNPGAETEQDNWGIFAQVRFPAANRLQLSFIKGDDSSGDGLAVASVGSSRPGATVTKANGQVVAAGDNGAKQFIVEVVHELSKRTEVGVGYNRLINDEAGLYRIRGMTRNTGESQKAVAVTVRHRF